MLILKKNTERGTYARNPAALYEVKQPHEKSPPLKDTIYLSLYKNESLNVFQYTDSRYKSFSSYRAMSSNYPNPGKDSTVSTFTQNYLKGPISIPDHLIVTFVYS